MTKSRRLAIAGVFAAAVTGVGIYWLVGRGAGSGGSDSKAGVALAAGIAAAIEGADAELAPHRCATLRLASTAPSAVLTIGDRTFTRTGAHLRATPDPKDARLVIGVVADARGAHKKTLDQVRQLRAAFIEAGVDLVVSLGGIATTREDLSDVLGAIATDAPWPVVAIPGARETLNAHRAAIAELADNGVPIFDGSDVRLIDIDGAVVATLPGIERVERLTAGAAGCFHSADDARALAAALPPDRAIIWASHAPPRQRGLEGSDRTFDGIHVGERSVANVLAGARVRVVLSALVDEAGIQPSGEIPNTNDARVFLASGPIEAMPITAPSQPGVTGAALLVTIESKRVRWQRLLFRAGTLGK